MTLLFTIINHYYHAWYIGSYSIVVRSSPSKVFQAQLPLSWSQCDHAITTTTALHPQPQQLSVQHACTHTHTLIHYTSHLEYEYQRMNSFTHKLEDIRIYTTASLNRGKTRFYMHIGNGIWSSETQCRMKTLILGIGHVKVYYSNGLSVLALAVVFTLGIAQTRCPSSSEDEAVVYMMD